MTGPLFVLFGALSVLSAAALIFVVVIQNSKGGGLSSTFGGASGATQLLGSRRSNEFIEKLTWYLAAFLVIVAIMANWAGTTTKGVDTTLEMRSSLDKGAFQEEGVSELPSFEQAPAEGETTEGGE